jgi:hypothetical protein
MPNSNADRTMSKGVQRFIETGVVDAQSLALDAKGKAVERRRWDEIIDQRLIEWGRDPSQLNDDGVVPPARDVVRRACQLAAAMRDSGLPAPSRVVPSGEGGIVFERQVGPTFTAIEVQHDGTIEVRAFHKSKMVTRNVFQG